MAKCMWCTRNFTPRDEDSINLYALLSAGLSICWSCADLFDLEEIKLHVDCLKAQCDEYDEDRLCTESGFPLPLQIQSWKSTSLPWRKTIGRAVDHYGKLWAVIPASHYLKLKPIGDSMMSLI